MTTILTPNDCTKVCEFPQRKAFEQELRGEPHIAKYRVMFEDEFPLSVMFVFVYAAAA